MTMAHGAEHPTRVTELAAGSVEYRLERHGPGTVVMLHGGHMRADLPLGEEVFARAGFSILALSRPGYGRTPVTTGTSPDGFADVIAELCGRLSIAEVAAVVGQSAGGPTAIALAARHPGLVRRLVLESAVGFLPWPGRRTRLAGRLLFAPRTEAATWALTHALMRRAPQAGLRFLLRDLTARPVGPVLASLDGAHRAALLELFTRMRSSSGFQADLRHMKAAGAGGDGRDERARRAAQVTQPTLIIASPDDGAVPYAQAEALAATIPGARLITSRAESHMIWFAEDYPALAAEIAAFLSTDGRASP
ncbi:alpha/beta fold hydrolase [Actinomadura viridis]|uniref:alpha/beta fold hydrolase n=1 Tax=Actinomadura viridis TaxID=58110 RepID=UPI00368A17EF